MNCFVMNRRGMSGLFVHWSSLDWFMVHGSRFSRGFVSGGSDFMGFLGHLLSHEFLIHLLGNFDILDSMLCCLVNGLSSLFDNRGFFGSSGRTSGVRTSLNKRTSFNGSGINLNVSYFRLIHASLLRDLNISRASLVARLLDDIADGAFDVSRLLDITWLSVHWCTDVAWSSILRCYDVCIVRSGSFFSGGVCRSKGGANE